MKKKILIASLLFVFISAQVVPINALTAAPQIAQDIESGYGAIVTGYTNVCPQFRLIARSGSTITTIWTKGPSSGGTC